MPNFVDDLGALPFPKSDKTALPAGEDATKHVAAADWNALCQAAVDLRGAVLGGPVASLQEGFEGVSFPPPRFTIGDGDNRLWEFETVSPLTGLASAKPVPIGEVGEKAVLVLRVVLSTWSVIGFRFATTIHYASRLSVALDANLYGDTSIENRPMIGNGAAISRIAGGSTFEGTSEGVKNAAWMSRPLAPGVHTVTLTYECNNATDSAVVVDSFRIDPVEMEWGGWRDDFLRGSEATPVDPLTWDNALVGSVSATARADDTSIAYSEGFGWIKLTAGDASGAAGFTNTLTVRPGFHVPLERHQFVEARFSFGDPYANKIEFGIATENSLDVIEAILEPGVNGDGLWRLSSNLVAEASSVISSYGSAGQLTAMTIRLVATATGTDMYIGNGSSSGNYNQEQLVKVASVAHVAAGRPFFKVTNLAGYNAVVLVDYIRAGWLSRFYDLDNSWEEIGV